VVNTLSETTLANKHIKSLGVRTANTLQAVESLSGGNQQKVLISRWLERDCEVVLFDEPTRGIDVGAKQDIYQLLNMLTEKGK
ncbi:MAG: ATP-binding cassette domain-containing protein, partial [Christensenellaceae bacterium]